MNTDCSLQDDPLPFQFSATDRLTGRPFAPFVKSIISGISGYTRHPARPVSRQDTSLLNASRYLYEKHLVLRRQGQGAFGTLPDAGAAGKTRIGMRQ